MDVSHSPAHTPRYVGVIGGRDCTPAEGRLAYELGQGIAREGWVLVCGGMGGVMAEACRGARQAGGVTLGILIATPFILFATVISTYTATAYHTCLYLWARDVERARLSGQTGIVTAPEPLAAALQ